MMQSFKFEIGSFVRMVISQSLTSSSFKWVDAVYRDPRGQVIARHFEECPGGTQIGYDVRWCESSGLIGSNLMRHNEIELVASEPFPPNIKAD